MIWEQELIDRLADLYKDNKTYKEIALELDLRLAQVRQKISTLGMAKNQYKWSEDEERMLIDAYMNCDYSYELMLNDLSKKLKRLKSNVCRKARAFGLTDIARKQLPVEMQKIRKPKYATKEERNAATSRNSKAWIAKNGHPRGALGMKHTEENKQKQSIRSKARMDAMSEEEKTAMVMKAQKTRETNGTNHKPRHKTTWKGGWREIGGKRKFFRSRWEANYAHYLEYLKTNNKIIEWLHEPETFWFEGVKRGAVSYLPDFKVTNLDGSYEYHEVKGWMDDRSKTKLKRMAKYHPEVKLILVDVKVYEPLEKQMIPLIPEWEKKQPKVKMELIKAGLG